MSALDQAFIKAYRRGAEETSPNVNPAVSTSWPPHAPPTAAPVTKFEEPHASIGAPHASFAAAQERNAKRVAHASSAQSSTTPATHQPSSHANSSPFTNPGAFAPLSSFTQQSPPRLEPAYEVARFTWPRTLEELTAEASEPLSDCGALLVARAMQQRKLVLVTGSRRDEGRSTILLMLARAAASRGLHVVMVDADVRRPQLATLLGVSPACGWEAVAAGEAPLHEALIESPLERLTLLPFGGRAVAIDEGSRSSLSLAGSLATLRENYELVLIDVGPLESDSVAIDLATRLVGCPVDDAIICRDASSPEAESLSRVGRRLAAAGVAHWDVVDNFTKRGS